MCRRACCQVDIEFAYNDQIVPLHDQTGRQEHGPKDRLFVLAQGVADCQKPIDRVALLRLVDQVESLRTTELQALNLPLSQDNSVHSHDVCDRDNDPGRRQSVGTKIFNSRRSVELS